jgi:hypothetical protein
MANLIGSVQLTPTNPRPCESVRVEVLNPQGQPLSDTGENAVLINGVPGAIQYLQFRRGQPYTLVVRATTPDITESITVEVPVSGEPITFRPTATDTPPPQLALLHLTQSQTNPYIANLHLGDTPASRQPFAGRQWPQITKTELIRTKRPAHKIGYLQRAIASVSQNRRGRPNRPPIQMSNSGRVAKTVFDLGSVRIDSILDRFRDEVSAQYEWDFGDGVRVTTTTPNVTHDFFHAVDHSTPTTRFHVRCLVVHEGIEIVRTLNLHSAYAACRERGIIVPHVTSDIFAGKKMLWFTASLVVYNVENQPLTIDKQAIVPLSDDPSAQSLPGAFVNLASPIVLPPRSSTVINVGPPLKKGPVPYNASGFTVYHAGRAADGTPVRFTAVFEVPIDLRRVGPQMPDPRIPELWTHVWPWEEVQIGVIQILEEIENPGRPQTAGVDSHTGTIFASWPGVQPLYSIGANRKTIARITGTRLSPAFARGLRSLGKRMISTPRLLSQTLQTASSVKHHKSIDELFRLDHPIRQPLFPRNGPPPPGMVAENEICDPDQLTEQDLAQAEEAQLVCQLTTETQEVLMPGRFMNARKGDIILSPGGTGLVGMLLRSVSPSQRFSHSGIMTRNYDEVTHSTASEELIAKYIEDEEPTDGLPPKMIKYMWPGVVAQSVEAAIHGEMFPHPDGGEFPISSFSPHMVGVTHNDAFEMVSPLVVKPDPFGNDTAEIRTQLHAVADEARNGAGRPGITSKSHYRLFCYTDPTIGQTTAAPMDAGWAAGTFPSVCSSSIWIALKKLGVRLETDASSVMPSDLEPEDVAKGAFVTPGTPDGLYTYTAKERLEAGTWLFDKIHNDAFIAAGWFGEGLTDASDDIANQVCNTFANDDAEGKDSEEWRNVRDANAVSPENILWWDGPDKGGLYGFAEPLIYREPRTETYTVSKWKKVTTRGTIHGTVTYNGSPVSAVLVRVYEGKTDYTDSEGQYRIENVPLGMYNIVASKLVDGTFLEVTQAIELDSDDMVVDLALQPPSSDFRLATVFFDFFGEDYETFDDNETTDPGPEIEQLELGPDRLVSSFERKYKWGGELRVEYVFTIKLLVGNVMDVEVRAKLFEGTDEDTDDLDGEGVLTFQVAMGETGGGTLTVKNTDEDEDEDQGILTITVRNDQNNN